ncbi:MAG: lactate racemase domain-containing protein, partial [Bacteroidota bacterium]
MKIGQTLRLRVSSAGNEREEEFPLPAGWAATVFAPKDRPAMTDAEVSKALANAVGTEPIAEAARGAKKAVLLVDDFRRPT